MSEMVERVARALFSCSVYHGYNDATLRAEWTRTASIHRAYAIAAIKAMREPTKEMCEEGLDTGQFENGVFRVDVDAPREVYRVMIDAALPTPEKDKPE